MTAILHDLRRAVRSLRRSPGFSAVTIATLTRRATGAAGAGAGYGVELVPLLACLVPAVRAARISPLAALRHD